MISTTDEVGRGERPPKQPSVDSEGIEIIDLVKTFRRHDGTSLMPVNHTHLSVARGEIVVLLGPSGCGKTTLLRCIAGLEKPDSGKIAISGVDVYDSQRGLDVPIEARKVSMVFQSYALWPHMTVYGNVAYPLRVRKLTRKGVESRVREILGTMGIWNLRGQYPSQLSGGQQQRVALARAVAPDTGIVLFDEPLSNVDARVREQLRIEMVSMKERLGFAGVYVTHDQEEAMEVGDRIAVMDDGVIAQLGTAEDVYARPRTSYVANFVGAANQCTGSVQSVGAERITVQTPVGSHIELARPDGLEPGIGDELTFMWRPEATTLHSAPTTAVNCVEGVVEVSLFGGPFTRYVADCAGWRLQAWEAGPTRFAHGDSVWLRVAPEAISVLHAGAQQ
jgi:ABC-type Fe3+/spermidine/putrescine transport system ATPase subunit